VSRPVDVLLEFLEAEQARGVTHVHLDDGAREALREVFNSAKAKKAAPPRLESTPTPTTAEIHLDPPQAPVATAQISIEGATRAEQIDSLRRQAENWAPAKSLGSLRETMVFSAGNPEARVMLVGEAPGYQEERERQPFVGPAGQKLNDILKAMGLSREEVYISNIVKFRPSTPKQTTNNRKPVAAEIAACLPFIRSEIDIVRPACIVALGETAAEGLLEITGTVASLRERWHDYQGTPVRVTYHPSYLLQTGDGHQTKRQVWEDMLAVMEKLELPISEKQRGFFLPKA
jgi:uracil-DNA glycosylase family 4